MITGLQLKYNPHIIVLTATVLVAGSFISADALAQVIPPISLTLLRFTLAALLLLPLIIINRRWRSSLTSIMPRAMGISLFYALFFVCMFESLKFTSAVNTATLFTLVPFVTALLCLMIFKNKINKLQFSAYVLAAIGTCWVIFKGDMIAFLNLQLNKGDYIFLLGALSMCCYSVSMKWLYRGDEMVPLVFCTLVGGIIWMLIALYAFDSALQWNLISGPLVFHMGYLVIGATLATMYLFQRATIDLGPSKVMAYSYLTPAVLVVLMLLINDQPISINIIPGIILSSVCTIILQRNHR